MSDRATINAQGIEVTFYKGDAYADYVSLTDIARYKSPTPKDVIKNWMRTHDVIEYLGLWETLYNPSFKGVEFDSLSSFGQQFEPGGARAALAAASVERSRRVGGRRARLGACVALRFVTVY